MEKSINQKSEEAFFVWYDKINAYAKYHELEVHQVWNVRQIFDHAFTLGWTAGVEESLQKLRPDAE
jgi:hypothetical protein